MIFRIVTDLDTFCEKLNALLARHDGRVVRSHGNPPQILTVPDGAESSVVSFNTDVPHLRSLGRPLLFGPGSILDAHGDNEKISKKELLDAITTYEDMVVTLLKN
jgi:acetylornithine deacetylase/succinyl-diaminopimelate desuccinylase-like protein